MPRLGSKAVSILVALALVQRSVHAVLTQCIGQSQNQFGVTNSVNGTAFNTYNAIASDSNNYVIRLKQLELCQTTTLGFTGMRGELVLINPGNTSDVSTNTVPILDVGNTNDCNQNIQLDLSLNETITNITFYYDDYGVRQIVLTSSLNRVFTQGGRNDQMTAQQFNLGAERPLLGFWGTATEYLITSLGVVGADGSCIPIPGLHDSSDTLSTGGIVGIIFGSLFFSTCVGALIFVGVKMGCCKKEQVQKFMKRKQKQDDEAKPSDSNQTNPTPKPNSSKVVPFDEVQNCSGDEGVTMENRIETNESNMPPSGTEFEITGKKDLQKPSTSDPGQDWGSNGAGNRPTQNSSVAGGKKNYYDL